MNKLLDTLLMLAALNLSDCDTIKGSSEDIQVGEKPSTKTP